jgi:acyl-CoA synthetase (NDP forming)
MKEATTPNRALPRLTIAEIFEPRRVAVFGASDDRGKWGGRIMHYLTLHGFRGEPIPINPRRDTVQGRKCYAHIGDAPKVDVAVIAVPAPAVPRTLQECAAADVGCCVIITAGFAEADAEGAGAQKEIEAIAASSGMRLVGPNCLGLINLRNGMALTSARVLDVDRIIPGHIGLVSQSGALMLSVYNRAHDQGIGFSQIVSVGNQADLEVCDFFEHMIGDPDTKAICLHIEGLREGARFMALLGKSREAGKPVIVLKTGRSAEGEVSARSHTASLAGAYPVFAAVCRDAGAILVDDPDVMVLIAHLLLRCGPAPGDGVGIISSSGGMNGIVADRMADAGLRLARFAEATRKQLSSVMLPGHLDNPVDMGTRRQEVGEAGAIAPLIARAVLGDPDVGVVFVPLTTIPNYEASVTALSEGLAGSSKPVLFALTPGSVATTVRAIIREKGIPYCDRIDDAMRMLRAYVDYRPRVVVPTMPPRQLSIAVPAAGYLAEPEAKALLAAAGLSVTRETRVRSRLEARLAAQAIGFPVVLKGISCKIVHKSDAGLVRLGLADSAAVEAAFDLVCAKLAVLDPSARECLVAETVQGELELIVGVKNDPQFGPAVMVGAGGVLVELFGDVEVALAPLSPKTAEAMLGRLRIWPLLLGGIRGRPALDIAAVVNALVQIGELAAAFGGRLAELDINPLMVRREGKGVVAADARAVIA